MGVWRIVIIRTKNKTMREIKFRAWDNILKKMLYTEEYWIKKTDWYAINRVRGCAITETDTNNGVLMQYTGLKDKNGKEIYEGDIVTSERFIHTGDSYYNVGVIKYREDIASFVFDEEEGGWDSIEVVYQVIGNIYENPELLIK